jgi:hypothetical protein
LGLLPGRAEPDLIVSQEDEDPQQNSARSGNDFPDHVLPSLSLPMFATREASKVERSSPSTVKRRRADHPRGLDASTNSGLGPGRADTPLIRRRWRPGPLQRRSPRIAGPMDRRSILEETKPGWRREFARAIVTKRDRAEGRTKEPGDRATDEDRGSAQVADQHHQPRPTCPGFKARHADHPSRGEGEFHPYCADPSRKFGRGSSSRIRGL